MLARVAVRTVALAGVMFASGGKPVNPPPAPNSAEIRISNELVPAGGTVQVKYSLTNPQPIMSGGTSMDAYQLDGVSLWSSAGDAAGVAVASNGKVFISAVCPSADLGLTEYPFLTMTMSVPSSLTPGTSIPLTMSPSTDLTTSLGPLTLTMKPATLTVGGNFSIHGVTPGGGTYPAGTTIRIDGQGFLPNAQLRTREMKFSSYKVVSSTEIDFTLKEQATIDGQAIEVSNGPFVQTYYSYLRGVPLRDPSRTLLKNTDPIFQRLTHALASEAPFKAPVSGKYTALALQNPNPGPVVATLTLKHLNGSASTAMIVLPSGSRIMDSLAALVHVNALQAGDQFSLVATTPIQILGLTVDENAGTVQPFLPTF